MKERLIVVGNGMAGVRAVEELLARAPKRYDITVFGSEPRPTYNRILLSSVLAGEKAFEEIVTHDHRWYAENGIALHTGLAVVGLDPACKRIDTADGRRFAYDRLLLATGSHPFIVPVPGKDLKGVVTFRDMADVEAMLSACGTGKCAVVIGGGLLGLEAANGLLSHGMTVTVLHLRHTVMERQLDESASYLLKRDLENRGLAVLTEANTEAIIGDGKVEAVRLDDGRKIPANIVVMAVGIRPNADLARAGGLFVERGVVVDDRMVTSDSCILAVGECVQHRGQTYGLVAPLYEMAKVAADTLAERAESIYVPSLTSTKLKVTGIDVFSAGDFAGGPQCENIVFRDAARGVYKRIVLKENRVAGAVLYGDTADGAWYVQLMREGAAISGIRDTLIFGTAFAELGSDKFDEVAALAARPENVLLQMQNG